MIECISFKYPEFLSKNYKELFIIQLEKLYCKLKKIDILYNIVDKNNL